MLLTSKRSPKLELVGRQQIFGGLSLVDGQFRRIGSSEERVCHGEETRIARYLLFVSN